MVPKIKRRTCGPADVLAAQLHPVLRRVYAGRGVGSDADLDLSLERLVPVGTLQHVDAAAQLLAAERKPSLIVTVDNGVSSVGGVEAARELGIPVLVTDHHLPGIELPRAAVIVNPNLADSRFASKALAGVGVAFYVMVALARHLGRMDFR